MMNINWVFDDNHLIESTDISIETSCIWNYTYLGKTKHSIENNLVNFRVTRFLELQGECKKNSCLRTASSALLDVVVISRFSRSHAFTRIR